MKQLLEHCSGKAGDWIELRYHERRRSRIMARNGRIEDADSLVKRGVGVRALVNGAFGFASTTDVTEAGILLAMDIAAANARSLAQLSKHSIKPLPIFSLAKGEHIDPNYKALQSVGLQDKFDRIVQYERAGAAASKFITYAQVRYIETLEDKIVVTNDGASAHQMIAIPEFAFSIVAEKDGEQSSYHNNWGVRGDWVCLFEHSRADNVVDKTAQLAVDLLSAEHPTGGRQTVVMAPSVVGLLSHEAIGHTVEADLVLAGSVAAGKVGHKVASDLVTLCDSGDSPHSDNAAGCLYFDDEGVPCKTVKIIENGVFKSYLHNRESAAMFDVEPTGNARAWLYSDEPLIRMRNTYIEPGTQSLEEIIANTPDGLFLEGANSGQADSTGEFMFGVGHATEIKNGKLGKMVKEATISGVAFDVLSTVDAVSSEFIWDLGSGYCGKGQPAKVDAGGPYIRCKATVGGRL